MLVQDAVPELVAEMRESLVKRQRLDLASQLPLLTIEHWTYDSSVQAIYVTVGGVREPNVVERNIVGARYERSIHLTDLAGIVVVDQDNFGRISGIEIIGRKGIAEALESVSKRGRR